MTTAPEAVPPCDRRQSILRTASGLFAARGYDGTSMRDVAEACGISKALLYHHFANKEDLHRQVVQSSAALLLAQVRAQIPAEGDAAAKVRGFMLATAGFFEAHRADWIAATAAFWGGEGAGGGEDTARRARIETRDGFEQLLRGLLQDGVDSGVFAPMDVAMTGRLILSALNWMHKWYDPAGSRSPQEIAALYFDTLLQGLAVRG